MQETQYDKILKLFKIMKIEFTREWNDDKEVNYVSIIKDGQNVCQFQFNKDFEVDDIVDQLPIGS